MILHSQLVFQHSVVVSIFNPADATAYKVTTSSLSVEMEVVLHAVLWIASRGDSQTTDAINLTDSVSMLQKVNSGTGIPDLHLTMFAFHLLRLLWMYDPGHARTKAKLSG